MSQTPPPPSIAAEGSPGDERSIARDVRTVSMLTLISRFGGLARDVCTVRVFGDTAVGSAFAAAFLIPNLFRRLFGEGALAAAFLPEYARADRSDPELRDRLASLTILLLALITVILTLIGELVLLFIVLAAPDDPERVRSFRLMMVMLPFMPLVCTAAILGAMLQVHGRFVPAAGAPILLNVMMILGATLHFVGPRFDAVTSAYIIGSMAVASGVLQIAWCLWALRRHMRWRRDFGPARPVARSMLRKFLPVVIGLGTIQLNALFDTLIAMWPTWIGPTILGHPYPLDEASNAILSYTQRLYQFPLGVFGIAVATAAFPALAAAGANIARVVRTLREAIRLSLFIGLPASVGLVLVRYDLTYVMFGGGGAFSDAGVDRASAVLLGYALGVWAYGVNHVLVRVFYARGDTTTPMKIALWAVGLNLVGNLILIWPLGEAGLAWSTALSQFVQTLLLARILRARLGTALLLSDDVRAITRIGLAALGMFMVVQGLLLVLPAEALWSRAFWRLALATSLGGAAYLLLASLLGLPERRAVLRRLGR
ncbi:MAG: murein biosynthesis integral membrane protein MurJ [Phycisphaeraceae bacterium]|nr:murein biosynthesis integral membrane protein MurJ [Phycisphaeraceae bacterium]